MEILTKQQMKEIYDIIKRHEGVLLHVAVGNANVDKKMLTKLGIPENYLPFIESGYMLGKLSQLYEDKDMKNMSYADLKRKAEKIRLTTTERNSLEFAKDNAAKYVTGLGQNMNSRFGTTYARSANNANLKAVERNIINDKVQLGILKEQTRGKLTSELGHATKDWERDWRRVAHTELWNAKLNGEAMAILRGESIYGGNKGGKTRVFRRPSADACPHCKRLYLKSNGVPKVFTLGELISNGTNVGRKASELQPVIGVTHPNCFLNGKIKIFTNKGYKRVMDIEVGDMVLTHKGRFKPVINTLRDYKKRYKGEYVVVRYKNQYGKTKKLDVTPEHKFMTNRGWVEAKDLNLSDKLKLLFNNCDQCESSYPMYGDSTLCGKCIVKNQWSERRKDEKAMKEFKDKVSKSVKKHQENPDNRVKHTDEFKEAARKRLLNKNPMADPEVKDKVKKANLANGSYDRTRERMKNGDAIKAMNSTRAISKPQRELFNKVLELYSDAELEYLVQTQKSFYSLDIVIPSKKINIEYDGSYWHKDKEKDNNRDIDLHENGWTVIRYEDYVPTLDELKGDLTRTLNNHDEVYHFNDLEITEISMGFSENKKLHDITVKDDHSFIAEGVVNHNCTCPIATIPEGFDFDENGELQYKGTDKKGK